MLAGRRLTIEVLLTIAEAAALLRVPEGWLRKKVTARAVPHTRLGKHVRFSAEHLRQLVAAGECSVEALPDTSSVYGVSRRARRSRERGMET